jgi:WD40 repeat protein
MSWRMLAIGALILGIAGCGGNSNPAPVAGNPAPAPALPGPPGATANLPGLAPLDSADLAIPLVGDAGSLPEAPKPTTPEPEAAEVKVLLEIDPNSSFDELSARFAKARADKVVQPNGLTELEQLYLVAMATPFGGKITAKERLAFFDAWHQAKPEDATPLILKAHAHIKIAWEARGSGAAASVTDEGWQVFKDELGNALKVARTAEALKPDDPELYHVLIILAKGLGGKREHVDRYVTEGRKIFPAYHPLYTATAEYLLPRWHGEPGDCGKFAEDVRTAIGGEEGLIAYARIALITNCYDSNMLYQEYDSAKLTEACMIMETRFPNATNLLNFLAINAWKSQDHAAARRYFARLQKLKPDLRQWGSEWNYMQFTQYCEEPVDSDPPDEFHWGYPDGTNFAAYLDGGKVLATCPNGEHHQIRIWKRDDLREPTGMLPKFPDGVWEMQGAGRRLMITAGTHQEHVIITFSLDDLEDPLIYKHPLVHTGAILSPDGKTAAAVHDKRVRLWDPATGDQLHELPISVQDSRMAFSPDSSRFMVTDLKGTHIYDVLEGKQLFELKQSGEVGGVRLHRIDLFWDSATLFGTGNKVGGKFRVVRWTPADNKVVELLRYPNTRHTNILAVSKNFVVMSESGLNLPKELHIHRPSDGKHLRTIRGYQGRVLISPDEKELVVASYHGPLRFWKLGQLGAQ